MVSVLTICDSHVADALAQGKESLHMVAELGCWKHRDGRHARAVHAGDAAATVKVAATATAAAASERPQLDARGFDNMETFVGGEDDWKTWSWKVKTAVSGLHGVLADVMTASETGDDRTIVTVPNDAMFVDVDHAQQGIQDRKMLTT